MKIDVFQADLFLQQQLVSQCLKKVGVVREAEIKSSTVIVYPFAHLWYDAVCDQQRDPPKAKHDQNDSLL